MKVKLWGTRGSLPRPMTQEVFLGLVGEFVGKAKSGGVDKLDDFLSFLQRDTANGPLVFGGHTTCTEFTHGNQSFFVDSGTGITDACDVALKKGQSEFHIFQTHMHWDHIMGLPFFIPIYMPNCKVIIHHVHGNAPEHIRISFNGINFPLKWEDLNAKIEFKQHKLYKPAKFGDVSVTPYALDHPGGSFGYRFEADGKSAFTGVDGEYKRLTRKELGKDLGAYKNLDLLIFDAQYEMDELASRYDWGHCSPPIGVDLALREGIRHLVLTHHDPRSSESKGHQMRESAVKHLKNQLPSYQEAWTKAGQPDGPCIYTGYDGMVIDLDAL